jgi:glycosyltransferase involved in cell wall biosynthesis
MKILMITHYLCPHIGGVESVVEKLFQQLRENDIKIITKKHEKELKAVEKFNRWTTVYRLNCSNKKYIGLFYIWKWMWNNRRLIAEADLVHVHDVFIWYLPFRFLFPFKPVYITFHGWEGKWPIPFKSLIQKKLAYYLTKGNICVGSYLQKYYGIKADILTYGGTNISKRQGRKIPNSFVYVGRLSEDTGLRLVLEVVSKLRNYSIEFCGDGELRKECEKYGKVYGFVKDPSQYLQRAQFCFAGGYLTILQAMTHKCIVIVCYQNPLKEDAFKDAPFAKYLILGNSSKNITGEIGRYQKDKKLMSKRIEEAYSWVKDQTWGKYTNQYKKLWGIIHE